MNYELLTVYSASAGSGKTFTLAVKYIELLIERPESYRSILAVTFTNKATDEMKLRILSQLYGLANNLPDSEDYARKIEADFKETGKTISRQTISRNAKTALGYLLHNYNYFRIQTIDAFFQSVMRNMARELNLNANFKLSLNDAQVEEKAVDDMIDGLTPKSDVMKWIVEYISDNISQDKNWNVIGAIKKFGMTIFNDKYKEHEADLNEVFRHPGFFKDFDTKLRSIMAKAEKEWNAIYEAYKNTLEANGTEPADFKNGTRGACGYFEKYGKGIKEMAKKSADHYNKTAQSASQDIGAWIKKADLGSPLETVAHKLMRQLNEAEEHRTVWLRNYKSADATLRHISELRLLGHIKDKVDEMNAIANRFQLSDTQSLLNAMIGTSDAPFVYEKIGSQINHIMIDEFQDTSLSQWKNFKVLLEDCMAQQSSCLIVGDVKQSIYRWRSSDWRLLNNITEEFGSDQIKLEPLDTNYRSEANIIKFNNLFFEKAAETEFIDYAETFPSINGIFKGDSLVQKISPKKESQEHRGHVEITLLPNADYRQQTKERIRNLIAELTENGVSQKDIAILTRSNSNIADIGEYLMEEMPELTLVSDEAFVLEASLAVRTIITAMQVMANEDDKLALATLARYSQVIAGNGNPALEILNAIDNLDLLLPAKFRKAERNTLATKPIYELAGTIADIFNLGGIKNEAAYLSKFFDTLANFISDYPATLKDIITEWDENMHKTPIESDKVDGIRMLTIHKSKGLEFDNVIIPFCDWRLESNDLFWVSPGAEPYNALPLVPVEFSKKALEGTIYETDYNEEHVQNLVDNMNLLYVAFTRAGKNLFVYGRNPDSKGNSGMPNRSMILPAALEAVTNSGKLEGCTFEERDDIKTFSFGDIVVSGHKAEKISENVFLPAIENISIAERESKAANAAITFRQSNKSREFVADIDDDTEDEQKAYIKTGTILHRIFSTIETSGDIDKALVMLEQEGELYSNGTTKDKLVAMLQKRLESQKIKEWFSPGWTLFNECTLLYIDPVSGKTISRRPDRVMTNGKETIVVDFKFAAPKDDHHIQVAQYVQLLTGMGYNDVKGYLWYVYTNKIVEVNKQ